MPQLRMKPTVARNFVAAGPRYEPRFVNGAHTIFDNQRYCNGVPVSTAKEALRIADALNEGLIQWAA